MRILLDENIPFGVRGLRGDHDVIDVSEEGCVGLSNGRTIGAAEGAGYDVMITADRNLQYQQNMNDRGLAIVTFSTNHWKTIRRVVYLILDALGRVAPGSLVEVNFTGLRRPPKRRPKGDT